MSTKVDRWSELVPIMLATESGRANLASGMPLTSVRLTDSIAEAAARVVSSHEWRQAVGRYHGVLGNPELRDTIAAFLAPRVSSEAASSGRENVLITPGAQAAFRYVGEHVRRQSRRLLMFGPEYPEYGTPGVDSRMACSAIMPGSGPVFRYALPDVEIGQDIGAVVVSSPGNPTGKVLNPHEIHILATKCERAGAVLVIDGAYGNPWPGLNFTTAVAPPTAFGNNVISVGSFAKAGLAGERLGFIVGPKEWIDRFAVEQSSFQVFPPVFPQLLALELISNTDYSAILAHDIRAELARRQTAFRLVLATRLNVPYQVHMAEGGQYVWMRLPALTRFGAGELFEKLLGAGVVVAPGAVFFSEEHKETDEAWRSMRISLTAPAADLEYGAGRIAEVVNGLH